MSKLLLLFVKYVIFLKKFMIVLILTHSSMRRGHSSYEVLYLVFRTPELNKRIRIYN